MAAALWVCSRDQAIVQACSRDQASMHARVCSTVTQHTLTCGHSAAALDLGLGIKGCHGRVHSATFVVIVAVATETVEVVAVGGCQFVCAH
jgi:hypothetical protein